MSFDLNTRMSEVLRSRPELRDILPTLHPAFARLAHPVLGKLLPRMVSVEDAARIAGLEPAVLLAVVNGREAHPAPAPEERRRSPAPVWLASARPVTLDVRPQLAAGEEPFPRIRAALDALRPGEVLTILADFEPAPLFRMQAARGWRTHGSWEEPETFAASFERPAAELPPRAVPADRLSRGPRGATLNVRGLEPPEPLQLTLAALEDPANLPLTLLHHREPALLWPRLAERGLRWTVEEREDGVEIRIEPA